MARKLLDILRRRPARKLVAPEGMRLFGQQIGGAFVGTVPDVVREPWPKMAGAAQAPIAAVSPLAGLFRSMTLGLTPQPEPLGGGAAIRFGAGAPAPAAAPVAARAAAPEGVLPWKQPAAPRAPGLFTIGEQTYGEEAMRLPPEKRKALTPEEVERRRAALKGSMFRPTTPYSLR